MSWSSVPEVRVEIFTMLRGGLMKEMWHRAGQHFSGGGLEQGEPSFQAFADAKKLLLKKVEPKRLPCCGEHSQGEQPSERDLDATPDAELAALKKLHGTGPMDALRLLPPKATTSRKSACGTGAWCPEICRQVCATQCTMLVCTCKVE